MSKKSEQAQVPPPPPHVPPPPPGTVASTTAQGVPVPAGFLDASVVFGQALNTKQEKKRQSKAKQSSLKMRKHLWPDAQDSDLWLREDETRKGFTTIPRTMPLFISLIQDASKYVANGKSVPAGKSYLVLWCRVFDEGFLKIDQEAAAALEAGYSGERNVTTWREHLRVLKELGFIDYKEGPTGPCHFVLLLNPYKAVRMLRSKGWVQEGAFTVLLNRALEIGATDLDQD
jgi:hypothetical protein